MLCCFSGRSSGLASSIGTRARIPPGPPRAPRRSESLLPGRSSLSRLNALQVRYCLLGTSRMARVAGVYTSPGSTFAIATCFGTPMRPYPSMASVSSSRALSWSPEHRRRYHAAHAADLVPACSEPPEVQGASHSQNRRLDSSKCIAAPRADTISASGFNPVPTWFTSKAQVSASTIAADGLTRLRGGQLQGDVRMLYNLLRLSCSTRGGVH